MNIDQDIAKLIQERLGSGLPGRDAQLKMTNLHRPVLEHIPDTAKKAAVLQLIYPNDGKWHIVFIERATRYKEDLHKGQISFPGGRMDDTDQTLEITALREAQEEVNVNPERVNVLADLTPLYIPVSEYHVHPFLGMTNERPAFIPDKTEVEGIIEVPLSHILDKSNIKRTTITASYGRLPDFPYFDFNGRVIWGATAMMLSELLEIIR